MPYGTIKIDTVTFTDAGVDKSVTLSGLVQNPTFSGNVTVTGTLSGVTVTGTTANFTSGNFTNISGGTHTITSGVFAAGSAASPSITFTGDLNTGIYSPGADQVAISTGGSGRLFINSSGNAGVGTSTPNVTGFGGATVLTVSNTASSVNTGVVEIQGGSSGNGLLSFLSGAQRQAMLTNTPDGQLQFWTGGASISEKLRITSAGLVGVGTSSPNCLLEVKGGSAITTLANSYTNCGVLHQYSSTSLLAIGNDGTSPILQGVNATNNTARNLLLNPLGGSVGIGTSTARAGLTVALGSASIPSAGAATGSAVFSNGSDSGVYGLVVGANTSGVGYIQSQRTDGTATTYDLAIQPNGGRVGIGTTSPVSKLHVAGDSFFEDWIYSGNSKGISSDSASRPLLFGLGGTERLRIDSSGRVGIGTSSPAEALEVAGKARILNNTGATNTGDQNVVVVGSTTSGAFSSTYGAGLQFQITNSSGGYSGPRIVSRLNADNNTANLVFQSRNYGFSDAMTLDSSGRLGIGTTTPAAKLHVNVGTNQNYTVTSTNSMVQLQAINDAANAFTPIDIAGSYIKLSPSSSEAARIDTSGRLLVGTSSARSNFDNSTAAPQFQIENASGVGEIASFVRNQNDIYGCVVALGKTRGSGVGSNTVVSSGDTLGRIAFAGADGSELVYAAEISASVDGTPGANDMPGRLVFSTTADGASSPTERMRIRSNGEILLGGITSIGTYNQGVGFGDLSSTTSYMRIGHNSTGAAFSYITFGFNTGDIGNIAQNSAGTAVSYNTTSDYRLKENVTLLTGATNRLKQLPVHRFNFIADPENTVDGFLAHEAQAVVPECVTGEKDAVDDDGNPVYQGIDQSKLVPLLTAALQEAIAEIETLKARLTAAGI